MQTLIDQLSWEVALPKKPTSYQKITGAILFLSSHHLHGIILKLRIDDINPKYIDIKRINSKLLLQLPLMQLLHLEENLLPDYLSVIAENVRSIFLPYGLTIPNL